MTKPAPARLTLRGGISASHAATGGDPGIRRISLSYAPFYAAILVILGLTLFIGIFWMVNEYQAYQESIDNIHTNYHQRYRDRVQEEHGKIINFIEYMRAQADQRIEAETRDKVQAAYTIASHFYRLYRGRMSDAELRAMVIEALRPIRWNNERGYYFAGSMKSETIDLFADEPWFEGKPAAAFKEVNGVDVFGGLKEMINEKGAGMYRYDLVKPRFPGRKFPTIVFVKYFEPFDMFLGAGVSTVEAKNLLQEEILNRIKSMTFAADGEVLGFRRDGTIICSHDERLIGRSVDDFADASGHPYGGRLRSGADQNGGEFLLGSFRPSSARPGNLILTYVRAYRDWGWIFATSMSMGEMEKAIAFETGSYRHIAFKNVSVFIFLFIVAVALLLLFAYFYSRNIRHGLNLFTNFLRQATDSKKKIRNTGLAFTEFEELRQLANRMVDDRIHKEQLLRRDEQRLDALLKLGGMEHQTLRDKFDFILRQIVQITRSEQGYIGIVNPEQRLVSIRSLAILLEGEVVCREMEGELARSFEKAGHAGAALLAGAERLCNGEDRQGGKEAVFPYSGRVRGYIDVPVASDGRIVAIAGVCNNPDAYDSSDIRQIKMMLEGLWLQVQKARAEEEMARLERQIIAVSEEERSNIGRDLHDDLGSHLTGIELLTKVLERRLEQDDPAVAGQLGSIRGLIRDAIDKTRRLAHGLYPAHVIEHGLEAAVEELVNEVESLFRVQCTSAFEGNHAWADNTVATHVYYIIREAAFNAARHGRPDNIGIFISTANNTFSVRIADDGKGFDESTPRRGLGCHTMKYRAKAIGAELSISSGLERGTIVAISGEIRP